MEQIYVEYYVGVDLLNFPIYVRHYFKVLDVKRQKSD